MGSAAQRVAVYARAMACLALASLAESSATLAAEPPAEIRVAAGPWPEADGMFHRDPMWLGADGAASVELGDGRVLWLFSDTFIANERGADRLNATMVRNSVAIQSHTNPLTAEFDAFYDNDGDRPRSFFPEDDENWFWPGDAELVDGKLIVFLMRVERSDRGLGFKVLEWGAMLVDNPLESPDRWTMRRVETPSDSYGVRIGFGTVHRDGDYLYAYGPRMAARHALYLVRWPTSQVLAGDLKRPQWWSASEETWRPHDDLTTPPDPLLPYGQPEFTVHYHEPIRRYLLVQTTFFPVGPLGARSSSSLTGPWTAATEFYAAPEAAKPPEGFHMYSAKAHPEQEADGRLAVTYCTNLSNIHHLVRSPGIYYPRFVRLDIEPAQ